MLHSKRGYVYLFAFVASITLFHFSIHLFYGSIPQIVKFMVDPTHNAPLDSNVYNEGWSITYFFRNVTLNYLLYPMLLFTFLIDYLNKEKWLRWLNWKTMLTLIALIAGTVVILGRPQLNSGGFSPIFANVSFGAGGGFYIFALATWITLVVASYAILEKKMQKHHALWFSLLIFLSAQEVWEYAPYLWYPNISTPPLLLLSLHTYRSIATFLLVFYVWKLGFNSYRRLFACSLAVSLVASIVALNPSFGVLGAFLRVIWAITYVFYALTIHSKSNIYVHKHIGMVTV